MANWDFDYTDGRRESWARNGKTDAFKLLDYNGLGSASEQYSMCELAELTGALLWAEGHENVLYPAAFRHSPVTGQPLPTSLGSRTESWLPPFGCGQPPDFQGLPGLRQTQAKLALSKDLTPQQDPATSIPLPPPGDYHFLVGNFSMRRPSLLAVEPRKGVLFVFRDSSNQWAELKGNPQLLPESSLMASRWGLACPDLVRRNSYLPTDKGLAVIGINILNLTYGLRLLPGRCVGAPCCFQGKRIFVPAILDGNVGVILQVDPRNPLQSEQMEVKHTFLAESFDASIIDRRQIIWLSRTGQLILKFDGIDSKPAIVFVSWPEGFQPCFEFGSPYLARDGMLWQLGFDQGAERYTYITLANGHPEKQETACPRFGSGTVNFTLETQLRSHPWLDPEEVSDATANHIVLPLLESPDKSALCARIPWNKGSDGLFKNPVKHTTIFQMVTGDGDIDFFIKKVARPWLARPFVYRKCIYLYHPDFDDPIPGWRLLA